MKRTLGGTALKNYFTVLAIDCIEREHLYTLRFEMVDVADFRVVIYLVWPAEEHWSYDQDGDMNDGDASSVLSAPFFSGLCWSFYKSVYTFIYYSCTYL